MPRPTMLTPGKIKILPHMTKNEINKINTMPAKDYIMEWFKHRVPARKGGIPNIKANSMTDRIMILRSGTESGKSTSSKMQLPVVPRAAIRFRPVHILSHLPTTTLRCSVLTPKFYW